MIATKIGFFGIIICRMKKQKLYLITLLLLTATVIRFLFVPLLAQEGVFQIVAIGIILVTGAFFLLRKSAQLIEETTEVLSERTSLAGGLLQSLGTAFPDMILGVVAAIVSLQLRSSDTARAIEYAIIAASTTFGSNIYNIAHACWCMYRQNKANKLGISLTMVPGVPKLGTVLPFKQHKSLPVVGELDSAIKILLSLTLLTSAVAVCMVLFGKTRISGFPIDEDLYQLIQPIGVVILAIAGWILYHFRKTHRGESIMEETALEQKYYRSQSNLVIFFHLLLAGIIILFTAESMVHAVQVLSEITGIPPVIAGALSGIIGCLGEILVIHNYTIHPHGRMGDALIGVGMDNIVTTAGAAIVAIMGGIFLGGSSLIVIFVLILAFNTLLLTMISQMKDYLYTQRK